MSPRRSSRLSKSSKKRPQRSPSPNEDVIVPRLSSKRQRAGPKKTKARDIIVNTDGERGLDIINSTRDAKYVAEEDGGKFVEVADEGVDESDDDYHSVTSSIASGPSFLPNASPKKPRPLQGMCSACWKLYQKAKKMRAPQKNKLLDNDPKSLTCDQWLLIKNWRPRRLPVTRGDFLTIVKKIKRRLVNKGAKQIKQCDGEGEPSACSRPHAFLQRNLRRCVKVPMKKESKKNRGRKRTRDDSQGHRVAKQQRLHSNNHHQQISVGCTDNHALHPASSHSSNDPADTDMLVELLPTAVTFEIRKKPREVPTKQKAKKTNSRFKDMLAQLRGNSSMVVRETH